MRWSRENKNFLTLDYQGLQCFYFGEQILEEVMVDKIKLGLLPLIGFMAIFDANRFVFITRNSI